MEIWEEFWKLESRRKSKQTGIPMESIIIKGRRQLFIDNWVIEHVDNLKKCLHQPVRHSGNPLIMADRPWELYIGYTTVLRDEEESCFKCWYATFEGLAYATSTNGIHWEKPILGLIECNGSTANNLVTPRSESAIVIKDPYEKSPEKRYKIMFWGFEPYGIYTGYSFDGIHWTMNEEPVLTSENDSGIGDHSTVMLDTARRRYIAFIKREMNNPYANGDWGMIQRMRCVSVSEDFEKWTDPVLTLKADDCDPLERQ